MASNTIDYETEFIDVLRKINLESLLELSPSVYSNEFLITNYISKLFKEINETSDTSVIGMMNELKASLDSYMESLSDIDNPLDVTEDVGGEESAAQSEQIKGEAYSKQRSDVKVRTNNNSNSSQKSSVLNSLSPQELKIFNDFTNDNIINSILNNYVGKENELKNLLGKCQQYISNSSYEEFVTNYLNGSIKLEDDVKRLLDTFFSVLSKKYSVNKEDSSIYLIVLLKKMCW